VAKFIVDPRQNRLFDVFDSILSETAKRRLQASWHSLFRNVILELLPAQQLGEHFHPDFGRPTKELFSMAGMLLIKEFKNLTNQDAADAYMFDASIQYALNLQPEQQSLCERTIERYQKLFREHEYAADIMQKVTLRLVEVLELDVSKQRLDSTHVQSNMAIFGRTRLMAVAIKNFLTQLKRHDEVTYMALDAAIRTRYEPNGALLFGQWKSDEDWSKTRQCVAEDMHVLVERFVKDNVHNGRSTYRMMCQVFAQQCEVQLGKVEIRKATGGQIIVNPSDPDATLDGHKGSGYQIQLTETCSQANETQLILSAIAQQAHVSDAGAVELVLEELASNDLLPEELLADTAYGSQANYDRCRTEEVELIAPVPGKAPAAMTRNDLTAADFEVTPQEKIFPNGERRVQPTVSQCPAGQIPFASNYDYLRNTVHVYIEAQACAECPLKSRCPVEPWRYGMNTMKIDAKEVEMINRRRTQEGHEFREKYRLRSGIESTNSILKRVTGMSRLRVRGKAAVFSVMLLKVAGFNILRSIKNRKLMKRWGRIWGGFFAGLRVYIAFIARFSLIAAK
jgi:hypothetical protein